MENAHDMRFIFYHKRNIDEGRDSVYTFVNMLEQAQIDVVDRAVLKHSYEEEDFVDEEMLHLILETLDIHIPIQYTPRCRRTMNAEAYGPTEPGILIDELFEYTIISFLFTMYSLAYDQSEENTIRCMKNFYVIEDLQRRQHQFGTHNQEQLYRMSMLPENLIHSNGQLLDNLDVCCGTRVVSSYESRGSGRKKDRISCGSICVPVTY